MSHNLKIDTVAIIESLPTSEKQTGKLLEEHLKKNGRDAVYHSVETADQFLAAIQDVDRMSRSLEKRVALHFEIHGNERGFGLSSGEFVTWVRVRQDIINLNFAQKNHLLVTMAVCRGTWLLEIMRATDTSPFYSMVSSQDTISENAIERGFPVFFDALFAGDSLEEATSKMNLAHSSGHGSEFRLTTTEETFANVFEKYFRELCTPEAIRARGTAVFNEMVKRGILPEESRDLILDLHRQVLSKQEQPDFENYRAKFFMHDTYPENMAEFCPTYEELRGLQ